MSPGAEDPREGPPTTVERSEDSTGYYGKPVIKPPVWTWEIPVYFFTGGLAGASSALSLAARARGNRVLARRTLLVGAAADVVSPALLISDLGRPERFINMLRVFKVTSPMNVGSWILMASGGASSTAAALELAGRLPRLKTAAEVVASLAGPPLASYTGALVANTAVPSWHEARRELPIVFGLSAAASAGAAGAMIAPPGEAGAARRLAALAVAGELAMTEGMIRRLGFLGRPYREGRPGRLMRAARWLAGLGAALLTLRGRRSRPAAVAGGAMVLAGEMCLRWGVFRAGFAAAEDPVYTIAPQRERANARAATNGDGAGG